MTGALLKHVREHFRTMEGYVSAGMEMTKDDTKIFLNANENPFELPGLEGLNRYPEPQPAALLEAFAKTYGVESDQIVITRGADEAIAILIRVFCEPHKDSVILNPPTFGIYGVDSRAQPANVIEVPLLKTQGTYLLDADGIIKAAKNPKNGVKLVFLCSPNNPTGTSFSHETISEICEALEGHAVVVLDETYAEFAEVGSMTADLETTPNLIILRTLSKSYAFAGMRIGCMIAADTDFISLVRAKALETYPLTRLSVEAAFHVLSPQIREIAHQNIKKLLDERDRMQAALEKSDQVITIYPSDANFLLVEMKDAHGFYEYAKTHNVILRDFSAKPGTENCIRLSIGTPDENDTVLKLLQDFSKT
ncbi:MAG: histidinol-phosphate transaminase [Alphaproteobacteria bacterium]|nr:histidinol-phosphate transaminase [Alphaproteobacteria bacterium]MCB9975221.1 histidinol-phosphate transaminase [Rhodospirillales bacterium]